MVQAIKSDLDLTDTQLGIISRSGILADVRRRRFADRRTVRSIARKFVIAVAVAVWSAFTAAGGATYSFLPFMFSRTGVAFGESALTPAAHSIFADYFPERQRSKVIAVYSCGIALGGFLALTLGGLLSDRFGWRTTLMIVGGVGLVLSLLVAVTVREPSRNLGSSSRRMSDGSLAALFADPTIRNTIFGGTILGLANGSLSAWTPAYIMRTFHLSASATGATYGTTLGIMAIVGTLAGGIIAGWLSAKDIRYGFRLLAIAFVLATFTKLASLITDNYVLFLLFGSISDSCSCSILARPLPQFSRWQSRMRRSFASAVTMFCINGVGIAGGAFLTGWLSDRLVPVFGADSLRWSLGILSVLSVWSALHYWRASYHLGRRAAKVG